MNGRFSSHVRKAHSYAGGTPDQSRCTTGNGHCVPDYAGGTTRLASGIPGYLGGFPGMTGGTTGVTGGVPDLAMSPHSATGCASGVTRWISRRTGGVSGVTGGVSSVDRCMNFSDLCGFVVFAAFLFSAIKPNPEKQPIEAFGWTKNIIDTNDFRGGKRAFEFLSREGREGGEVRRTGIFVEPAMEMNQAP